MKSYLVILCFIVWIPSLAQTPTGDYFNSFDKTKIYFETEGKGEPVILVHGFTGNVESWKKGMLYNDLLKNGYRVISIDLRGNGKSDKPHELKSYQDDAEAKDIMALASHLKIKKYHVVGYSRGAIIASRVAVLDNRAKSIVMGGMGDGFIDPNWPRRILFYKVLSNQQESEELTPMIKRIQDTGLDQEALACQQGAQPSTSAEEFLKVKQPVLVICGDRDNDNGSASSLTKLVPNGVFVNVPGDHGSTSRSQEFSNEIVSFLLKQR